LPEFSALLFSSGRFLVDQRCRSPSSPRSTNAIYR
jgi:hypothetical protein